MGDLEPLSEILKGNSDPNSSRQLIEAARQVLMQVESAIQKQRVHSINYDQPWKPCISPTKLTPIAVLSQNNLLSWLHLPVSPIKVLNPYFEAVACLAQKSRMESRRYFDREPDMTNVPYTKQKIDWFKIVIFGQLYLFNFKARLITFPQLIHYCNSHSYILLLSLKL